MDDPAELLDSKAELDQEEMERLLRENRALKGRLDELERENRLLKQRNFDLSMRYGRSVENRRQPFELVFSDSDIDGGDEDENENSTNGSDNNDVSGAGYSIEESESVRESHSGTESTGNARTDDLQQAIVRPESVEVATSTESTATPVLSNDKRSAQQQTKPRSSSISGLSAKAIGAAYAGTSPDAAAVLQGVGNEKLVAADLTGKDRMREKQRRVVGMVDALDADRDSSARLADSESTTAAREKKGVWDSEERHGGASAGVGSGSRRQEAKQLKCYAELDGHEGAIYSTQYSPSGGHVASASFDKSVRIWDIGEQKAVAVLEGHQQSVFDVAWREDSAAVASAAFDQTCIEWDLETRSANRQLDCDGMVQCIRYSTHNPRIIYSGDSSGFISIHDTRQAQTPTKLSNDGTMVNTIFCFSDETRLVSGDRNGDIKMWDVRIGRFMQLVSTQGQKQAISHISVVRNEKSGTEYMAANSYDNVLRVYDRVDDSSVPTPRVIQELRGIRCRNWPIKNAFLDPRVAQDQLLGLYDDDYYELDMRSQSEAKGLRSMLFLITGSAEPFAYLYNLNTHLKGARTDDKVCIIGMYYKRYVLFFAYFVRIVEYTIHASVVDRCGIN
ncbi:hypothetical protein H4S08_000637 [Coemansia sp. RSA 1365]|nr:hypothetical protein H4S08_000637 [Coemansia sp. RSA 1365]